MYTNTVSRTDALMTARKAVSSVFRSMGDWAVTGPFYPARPDGPVTERRGRFRQEAYQIRRDWVVEVALSLLGYRRTDILAAIEQAKKFENTKVEDMLNYSVRKISEWRLSSIHEHEGQQPETLTLAGERQ